MDIEVKRRDPKSSHAVGTESYEDEVEALIGQNNRQAAQVEIDTALRLEPEQAEFKQLREELQESAH